MQAFTTHTGIIATLNRANVDTDQIISKEFLKSISRIGYGEHLFEHWRYLENGQPNPDFELNNPAFQNASILVAGNNFGCGSSREHAVWAVSQYGFRVVLAPQKKTGSNFIPGFADIFRNNSFKNGLLTLEFPEEVIQTVLRAVAEKPGIQATIDLAKQTLVVHAASGDQSFHFEIDQGIKQKFLEGLDEIGQTEKYWNDIHAFEKRHRAQLFG